MKCFQRRTKQVSPTDTTTLLPPRPAEDSFLLARPQQRAHLIDADRGARMPPRRGTMQHPPANEVRLLPLRPVDDGFFLAPLESSSRLDATNERSTETTSSRRKTKLASRARDVPLLPPRPAEDCFLLALPKQRTYTIDTEQDARTPPKRKMTQVSSANAAPPSPLRSARDGFVLVPPKPSSRRKSKQVSHLKYMLLHSILPSKNCSLSDQPKQRANTRTLPGRKTTRNSPANDAPLLPLCPAEDGFVPVPPKPPSHVNAANKGFTKTPLYRRKAKRRSRTTEYALLLPPGPAEDCFLLARPKQHTHTR